MKVCSTCLQTKAVTEFYKSKKSKDGLCHTCKQCSLTRAAYWRVANKIRKLENDKSYRERNRQSLRIGYRKHYENNKQSYAEYTKRWRIENKEQFLFNARQQRARRRAMERQGKVTKQEWQDRLAEFNNHCAYCLQPFDKLEMEHMLPLSRGGTHTIDNIVPACRACNGTKSSKTLLEILPIPTLHANEAQV